MNESKPLMQPSVELFREVALWPVQLMPRPDAEPFQSPWACMHTPEAMAVWEEVADEFTDNPAEFSERHYKEFVTFLPFVQRFLYGAGAGIKGDAFGGTSVHVYRRRDVARVRIVYPGAAQAVVFDIAHVDLYFFYDVDVAILVVEIAGEKLSLNQALDTLYRFGRAYPTHWEPSGLGGHCAERIEWLSRGGDVLAVSDYENKEQYLQFVSRHRAPRVASHWAFLMGPLVLNHSDSLGSVRYQELEYQRMPLMGYLAVGDLERLTRGDLVRIGLAAHPGNAGTLPYSERFLADFEQRYCYDRYWEQTGQHDFSNTRFMTDGHSFTMLGQAAVPFFTDAERGMLGQFRHQYFLFFLIAHFHKAALLMLSDRLVLTLSQLDIRKPESARIFRRDVRRIAEVFLRFTHRYWVHEVSDQVQARELFAMMAGHLGNDELYNKTRTRILDMNDYLERDQIRRQADTVVRLTVVTTFGLIGTITTGFLGMNLIAEAENPFNVKLMYFLMVLIPTVALTIYTVVKSKRLSEFLEALSDERLTRRDKLNILMSVWRGNAK